MPFAPKRPCTYPGCHELTDGGRCEQHRKQERHEQDERRGTASSRGYTARWHEQRTLYLNQHPLCVTCHAAGKLVEATVVDHIIPHRKDMTLFWDVDNWQALCKQHHDMKTAKEDGRWG